MPVLGFDWYSVRDIVPVGLERGTTFSLVFDRNVVSRLMSLLPCRPGAADHLARRAAAVMAFMIVSGSLLDAVVALGETSQANGAAAGRLEALQLAAMQNLHPQIFADVALGRRDRIPVDDLARETTDAARRGSETLDVEVWRQFLPEYGAALKLALIRLAAGPREAAPSPMAEFLRWTYEDYMFLPGAVSYGSLAFSPSRHGRMFKRLFSGEPKKALAGVRNAAWDMGLLRYWGRPFRRGTGAGDEYAVLCSFDGAVLDCAGDTVSSGGESEKLTLLERRWVDEWGAAAGRELSALYTRYFLTHTTDSRRAARVYAHQPAYWEALVARLEGELVEAVRRRGQRLDGASPRSNWWIE
jgi:hypothetical protein